MLSPIPLAPGMDQATMMSVINANFRQLESENRTKIMKDEDGDNRIIMGRFPDGTYGFAISQKGEDVLELLEG